MKLTEASDVHTVWETRQGFDRFFDMVIQKGDYDAMRSISTIVGKAIDEVAKKHGYPFSFECYYRHEEYTTDGNIEES